MRESVYKVLKQKSELKPTKVKCTTYNGSQIPVTGQCDGKINCQGKSINLIFFVSCSKSAPILGLDSSVKLKLIKRYNITQDDPPNFFAEFNDCLGDIGSLPKAHHTSVKPESTPTISPARRVSIARRDKVKSELDYMIKLDVMEPISEPTEWVNPLLTFEQPNRNLRVCLYPGDLNKAIKRQHYKLPTAEELFSEMTGARYFSKLDASNGYWQIKIDTESSKLLTSTTPFERFCFKRLPNGIFSASEIFQADISEIIKGLEGARNSQDDIIVWGETLAEHNNCVSKVMTKIRECGLKSNKSKCILGPKALHFWDIN